MKRFNRRFYLLMLILMSALALITMFQYQYARRAVLQEVESSGRLVMHSMENVAQSWMTGHEHVVRHVVRYIEYNPEDEKDLLAYMTFRIVFLHSRDQSSSTE